MLAPLFRDKKKRQVFDTNPCTYYPDTQGGDTQHIMQADEQRNHVLMVTAQK